MIVLAFNCRPVWSANAKICQRELDPAVRAYNLEFVGNSNLKVGNNRFEVAKDERETGGIYIVRTGDENATKYNVSSRTYDELVKGSDTHPSYYPSKWLNLLNLRGLNIADLGCGNSPLVVTLTGAGAKAIGIDEFPSILMKTYPDLFRQASIQNLPFEANSQDLEISTMSLFSYEFSKVENDQLLPSFNAKLVLQGFNEVHRTLKKGGSLILSHITQRTAFLEYYQQHLSDKFDLEEERLEPTKVQIFFLPPITTYRIAYRLIKK